MLQIVQSYNNYLTRNFFHKDFLRKITQFTLHVYFFLHPSLSVYYLLRKDPPNHSLLFSASLSNYCIFSECISKFGPAIGEEVWEMTNKVFDAMPIAAIIDKKARKPLIIALQLLRLSNCAIFTSLCA